MRSMLALSAASAVVALLVVGAAVTGAAASSAAPKTSGAAPPQGPLPSNSLYQVEGRFEDQNGKPTSLAVARGDTVLLAMFYAKCPMACPMLISDIKRVLDGLDDNDSAGVRVVLVSLDPDTDTPAVLKDVFGKRSLDERRFTLLRTDETTTRTLAAALGVRYRENGDGSIDHTSKIVLLDGDGVERAARDAINSDPSSFVASIRKVLHASAR